MRALIFAIAALAACSKPNPYYCEGHPDDNCLLDADLNAPMGCITSAECTNAAKPVCEPTQRLCVPCTADMIGACAGPTPVCSATNTCTGCTEHGQCGSAVCLGDGSCASEPDVAYVSASGDDSGSCTRAVPCKTIAAALVLQRQYVKLQSNLDEAVVVTSGRYHFFAEPGTTLRRTATAGPIIELRGTSTVVAIDDLIIRGATGTTGSGIYVPPGESVELTLDRVYALDNAGNGLNVQGGKLTMSKSVVSGNSLGGAVISGVFDITNSLFVANGNGISTTGGLTLSPQTATTTFKFNTVAANLSGANSATVRGINCTLPMSITNTIVAGNPASPSCTFEYSLFDTGTPSGTNVVGDPMFKNINALDPLASDYFHIQPTSAAVDHADPVSAMATDIDGDARPQGNAPDIGADELN